MITDADVKKLAKVFATKDDLKIFATKDDLKSFATRDDFGALKNEIQKLGQKLDEVKTRLDVLEDNVTGEIAKLHDENLVTSQYRSRIEDHEVRISALETAL